MAGSGSSVHGENNGEAEVPVSRAEIQQMQNGILQLQQTMERLLNERPPARAMGFHTDKTLLTRTVKLAVKTPSEVLPAEDMKMRSTTMAEIVGKLKTSVLLLEDMVLLLVESREEDMIEGEPMVLVDATLTHMSVLLVVMVMSLMTMTVFHIIVLLHMVMMVAVMTVVIEMNVIILQE